MNRPTRPPPDPRRVKSDYATYPGRRFGLGRLAWTATNAFALLRPLLPSACTRLDRPVFIVGCSRAGTTIFADVFGAHPDLTNWTDAARVWDLHHYDRNADDYRDERHATAWECNRLRAAFGLYAFVHGGRRLVSKNNQNALQLRFLNRVFPDSILLHVVRDARPVVCSNVERTKEDTFRRRFPFGHFPKPIRWREYVEMPLVEQFAHQWSDITRYVQVQGAEVFGARRYAEIRYEDFCAHPEYALARIDAFCDLDDARRDPSQVARIANSRSDLWRNLLSVGEIERIHEITGPQMSRLGYSQE